MFNKIKVFFDDLKDWLGFLFQWKDILRTHDVLKNVFRQYAAAALGELGALEDEVRRGLAGVRESLAAWAGLPDDGTSIGVHQTSGRALPGVHSPQSNWGVHHARSNVASAQPASGPGSFADAALAPLGALLKLLEAEGEAFVAMAERVKTQVVDVIYDLTPVEAMKRLLAIVADFLATSAANVLVATLAATQGLLAGVLALLDAPIRIPVISKIYREVSGGRELSVLDLACLVTAIPVTVIHKMLTGRAPYPTDADAEELAGASSWQELRGRLARPAPARALAGGVVAAAATLSPLTAGAAGTAAAGGAPAAALIAARPAARYLPAAAAARSHSPLDTATIVLDVAAGFGSILYTLIADVKYTRDAENAERVEGGEEPLPMPVSLSLAGAAVYLPMIGPNIASALTSSGRADVVANDVITFVSVRKVLLDAVLEQVPAGPWEQGWKRFSPLAEAAINAAWLCPAIVGYVRSKQERVDTLGLVANVFFDAGGLTAPFVARLKGNPKAVAFAASMAMSVAYGVTCLITARTIEDA